MCGETNEQGKPQLPPERGGPEPKPAKPVKRVRVAEVVKTVRIETEEQRDLIRDRLDRTVKQELQRANDVVLL